MLFASCWSCCSRGDKAGFFGTRPPPLLDETDSESVSSEESCVRREGPGREGPGSDVSRGDDGHREVFHNAVSSHSLASLFYFDAASEPLGDDEYPSSAEASPPPPRRRDVSEEVKRGAQHDVRVQRRESAELGERRVLESLREPWALMSRPAGHPGNSRGYPGNLTRRELEECKSLIRRLRDLDPALRDQFYSFRDVEDEAFTICRWMRASNFSAKRVVRRLRENEAFFQEAKNNDFFPDASAAIGAPLSVFHSQFPFLTIGRARNGCCVNYLLAESIQPEGVFSTTTPEGLAGYFWWSLMWKLKAEMKQRVRDGAVGPGDGEVVLAEGINVVDLRGLSRALLSARTFELIQVASRIEKCFPETLHCMLLLNAPGFFSAAWRMIKGLLDPSMAKRIRVFSDEEQGLRELRRLVCDTQIPKDYGGTNKSLREALLETSGDDNLHRQEVELLHTPRGTCGRRSNEGWRLQKGEAMAVRVYTRSGHAREIRVVVDGEVRETFRAGGAVDGATDQISPRCTSAGASIVGPAEVSVEIVPTNREVGCTRNGKGGSDGYFLIVGDVRATHGAPHLGERDIGPLGIFENQV